MKPDLDQRNVRVVIYMTREDADHLSTIARTLRFRSRSTFIVSILERLLFGGFSIATFFKVGMQIVKRDADQQTDQFEFDFHAIRNGLRPLPALPTEDDPQPKEVRAGLRQIREELTPPKK